MFNSTGCSQRKRRKEAFRKSGRMKQTVERGQRHRGDLDAIKEGDGAKSVRGEKKYVSTGDMEESPVSSISKQVMASRQ